MGRCLFGVSFKYDVKFSKRFFTFILMDYNFTSSPGPLSALTYKISGFPTLSFAPFFVSCIIVSSKRDVKGSDIFLTFISLYALVSSLHSLRSLL